MKTTIEITNLSGHILHMEMYQSEETAQKRFDDIAQIKWPLTYKGTPINASEYPENRTGSIRLVVENKHGQFIRRELFRKA